VFPTSVRPSNTRAGDDWKCTRLVHDFRPPFVFLLSWRTLNPVESWARRVHGYTIGDRSMFGRGRSTSAVRKGTRANCYALRAPKNRSLAYAEQSVKRRSRLTPSDRRRYFDEVRRDFGPWTDVFSHSCAHVRIPTFVERPMKYLRASRVASNIATYIGAQQPCVVIRATFNGEQGGDDCHGAANF
jgi:hypothetical protein